MKPASSLPREVKLWLAAARRGPAYREWTEVLKPKTLRAMAEIQQSQGMAPDERQMVLDYLSVNFLWNPLGQPEGILRTVAFLVHWRAAGVDGFSALAQAHWQDKLKKQQLRLFAAGATGAMPWVWFVLGMHDHVVAGSDFRGLLDIDEYQQAHGDLEDRMSLTLPQGAVDTQTLWVALPVTRDSDLQALHASRRMPDPQRLATLENQMLQAWQESVDELVPGWVTDDAELLRLAEEDPYNHPAVSAEQAEELRRGLLACLELGHPLDMDEGFRRMQMQGLLSGLLLDRGGMAASEASLLQLQAHRGDRVTALAWSQRRLPEVEGQVALLGGEDWGPQTRLSVADALRRQGAPAVMQVLWPAILQARRVNSRETGGASNPAFAESADGDWALPWLCDVETADGALDDKALQWAQQWAQARADGPAVVFEAGLPTDGHLLLPSERAFELGRQARDGIAAERFLLQPAGTSSQGELREERTCAAMLMGRHALRLLGAFERWGPQLHSAFRRPAGEYGHAGGPGVALQLGMSTWIAEALSREGRELLRTVVNRFSPEVLAHPVALLRAAGELAPEDALALAEFISSPRAGPALSDLDFSWALAFANAPQEHALVVVRAALQERLAQTDIGLDVPAWTLRGPAALTYVEFPAPAVLDTRLENVAAIAEEEKLAKRYELLKGAYLWTREADGALEVSLAFNLWTVFEREGEQPVVIDENLKPLHNNIALFEWEEVGVEESLAELVDQARLSGQGKDATQAALCLKAIAKVLLYMGLRDARLDVEAQDYSANAGRGTNPCLGNTKSDKVGPKGAPGFKLHRIRVGPAKFEDDRAEQPDGSGRGVRLHWRRGHFRMQAFGPGRRDRRQTWIRPMLVGSAQDTAQAQSLPLRVYDAQGPRPGDAS